MHTRRILLPLLVTAVLAPAVPAGAGGWDSLVFREDQIVGEVATIRQRFFAGELQGTGPLDGGPYHAYLLPESRGGEFAAIEPPNVPNDAIRLGTLSVSGPVIDDDGYPYGVASLSFVVPDVPTGQYRIGFCDDPCVHSKVGWLASAFITIVHTRYESVLLRQAELEQRRVTALRRDVRLAERDAEEIRSTLAETRAELRTLEREQAGATTPSERASVAPVATATRAPEVSVTWWIALVSSLLGLVAGTALGRRSRAAQSPVVPDTVPENLEEREPALRR